MLKASEHMPCSRDDRARDLCLALSAADRGDAEEICKAYLNCTPTKTEDAVWLTSIAAYAASRRLRDSDDGITSPPPLPISKG